MALSENARDYLESLWGESLHELEAKRDSGLYRVGRCLRDYRDIYAQIGFWNYLQPELDHLNAIGFARAECWLKAFVSDGQPLNREAIEEALLDATPHVESATKALFEKKKNEIQFMRPIPPGFHTQPVPDLLELRSRLAEVQSEAKEELLQKLTIQVYERRDREHLASKAQAFAPLNGNVIHGDQIVNYGQAGAIGRHSQGVVNWNERWKKIEKDADLETLAVELGCIDIYTFQRMVRADEVEVWQAAMS